MSPRDVRGDGVQPDRVSALLLFAITGEDVLPAETKPIETDELDCRMVIRSFQFERISGRDFRTVYTGDDGL